MVYWQLDPERNDPLSCLLDGTIEEFLDAKKYQWAGYCEVCNYDISAVSEDMDKWSSVDESAPVFVTNYRETHSFELGSGADYTLHIRCPRCGYRNKTEGGYP